MIDAVAYCLQRAIKITALSGALLFAVHPVQTEAVTYISGRADPMSALFIILAVLFFDKKTSLSCLFFVLGLLSKEYALIAPLLIPVYFLFKGIEVKSFCRKIIPFVLIAAVYSVLRLTVLDFTHTIPENAPKAFFYVPFCIRLFTFLKAIPVYFGILLWPFGLHMERDMALSYSILQPQSALGFFMVMAMLAAGLGLRRRQRALSFAALWFIITIFPNSNIIPINALIYEHWLYLPSVGFFLILAWACDSLFRKGGALRYLSAALALSLILFYSWRTIERNKDWRDPIRFYEQTIKYKPDSLRLRNNLAMAYIEAGREEDAVREYRKAMELGDHYPQPHYNLSNIYLNRGDYGEAVRELEKSLEIDRDFLYSRESLASIYFNQGRFREAKKQANLILKKEPDNRIGREILKRLSDEGILDDGPEDIE